MKIDKYIYYCQYNSKKPYRVIVRYSGKNISLGYFRSFAQALIARNQFFKKKDSVIRSGIEKERVILQLEIVIRQLKSMIDMNLITQKEVAQLKRYIKGLDMLLSKYNY